MKVFLLRAFMVRLRNSDAGGQACLGFTKKQAKTEDILLG